MPSAPPRLCGCGSLHPAGERCPRSRPAWQRPEGATWGAGTNTRRWRTIRAGVLADTPLCRCGALATEVDHRWPLEYGGDRWDPWNLQALCTPCHKRKTRRERDGARRPVVSVTPYTVVCGPPMGGKSWYVKRHAEHGDLVLDLDELTRAVFAGTREHRVGPLHDRVHPFVVEMRDAALDRLARDTDLRHAWVITGAPRRADRARFRGAQIVMLPTPETHCLTRLAKARRPQSATAEWIRAWWAAYEPE